VGGGLRGFLFPLVFFLFLDPLHFLGKGKSGARGKIVSDYFGHHPLFIGGISPLSPSPNFPFFPWPPGTTWVGGVVVFFILLLLVSTGLFSGDPGVNGGNLFFGHSPFRPSSTKSSTLPDGAVKGNSISHPFLSATKPFNRNRFPLVQVVGGVTLVLWFSPPPLVPLGGGPDPTWHLNKKTLPFFLLEVASFPPDAGETPPPFPFVPLSSVSHPPALYKKNTGSLFRCP